MLTLISLHGSWRTSSPIALPLRLIVASFIVRRGNPPDEWNSTNSSFQPKPSGDPVRLIKRYKYSVEAVELVQWLWSFIVPRCRRHCDELFVILITSIQTPKLAYYIWTTCQFEYKVPVRVPVRVPLRVPVRVPRIKKKKIQVHQLIFQYCFQVQSYCLPS